MKTEEEAQLEKVFPFGSKGLIAFLAFLNAFVPLSIDLYLPAMPTMAEYFSATPELTNFTLSFFMLFFAISMLLWGPFTDKFGRKPILYTGIVLYILGSLTCVLSQSIYYLIAGRAIQAIGSGAIQAVSMAIVKDNFRGLVMELVLVWIQTLTILCPMLAPIIGAFLLKFVSWRGLFVALILCGILGLILSFFLKETLTNATEGSAPAIPEPHCLRPEEQGHPDPAVHVLAHHHAGDVFPVLVILHLHGSVQAVGTGIQLLFCPERLLCHAGADSVSEGVEKNTACSFSDDLFRFSRGLRSDDPDFRNAVAFRLCLPLYSGYFLRECQPSGRYHVDHEPDRYR